MKHIIYSILLSVGCFLTPFETVFAQADSPECMSVGTNFWFLASWNDADPFVENINWATAFSNGDNIWNPQFVDEIDIYSTLRFMDFGNINWSQETTWSSRRLPTDSHALPPGGSINLAYEWMIDLCNDTDKDIWLCIPHAADDNYVRELAKLIRDNLEPDRKVYLELSNEIWNFTFPKQGVQSQGEYADEEATILHGQGLFNNLPKKDNAFHRTMYWQSFRSVQIWDIWQQEFGGSFSNRVKKIIAGQAYNTGVGQSLLDALKDSQVNPTNNMPDAYAIAPYFGQDVTVNFPQAEAALIDDIDNTRINFVATNYNTWNAEGIELVAYEGGTHVHSAAVNSSINRHADIYGVYLHYLDELSNYLTLFNQYVHVGKYNGIDAWGAKEFIGQPDSEAHKYRALKDWINSKSCEAGITPGGGDCPLDLTISGYQNSQIQAANTVDCSAIVNSGSDVVCNAGTLITLTEGFHAKAGSTFHAFIEECTPTGGDCEVLTNSSFDSNTDGWNGYSCSASSSGGVANVSGIQSVTNFWEAIFRQENVTLQQGKDYILSIRAQSQNGGGSRPVTLKVTNSENGTAYNEHNIQLSTSMETFTFPPFNVNTGTNNAYVELLVGHNTTDIQVDFISLKESGDCDTPPPPPGGDCQLLTNTEFDSAFAPWAVITGCVPTIESGGTLRMEITNVDAGNAMVAGFEQTGLTLEQGKNYTLTFDARSGSRSIDARINNTTTQTFNLSGDMTTYTLNYSHQGNTTNFGKVEFFLGTSGAWVYFDNIELNGPCNNKEEVSLAPDIQLYPNPATNNIQVEYELPQSTSANILVFDAYGKVVKNVAGAELLAGQQILNMDISDLAAGMYFYTLQAENWKATKKFIVTK